MSDLDRRIDRFKEDVGSTEPLGVVRRHIIHGACYALGDDAYYDLRSRTALEFQVHPNEVLVVGSAKLGFSIAPTKMLRPFGESSDIDLVIVSPGLFEETWYSVFKYARAGAFWPGRREFERYLLQGWIRPDKLPPEESFRFCRDWWKFFRRLSASGDFGPYKVRGALYRSWQFLEGYHENSIAQYAMSLEASS